MKRQLKRALVLGIGSFFILAGIVGLFVPFLQGILFLILGLVILSKESKTAHRILEQWKQRHPGVHAKVTAFMNRIRRRLGMTIEDPPGVE